MSGSGFAPSRQHETDSALVYDLLVPVSDPANPIDRKRDPVMAGETTITVVGNITADPELRFTPSGAAVSSFTIASTPRTFDRNTNEWKDGDALFLRCSIWRQAAENVAESLTRGMRVIATGRLKQRSYETREGEKRTVIELDVDEIGPSLKYASAKVTKAARGTSQGFGDPTPGDDPWGAPPIGGSGSSGGLSDEPPF